MGAQRVDLKLRQGAPTTHDFIIRQPDGTRIDPTTWNIRAHIRTKPEGPLLLDLTPHLTTVTDAQSTDGPGAGIRLTIPAHATRALTSSGVWDLQLQDPGTPEITGETLAYGTVKLTKAVTSRG